MIFRPLLIYAHSALKLIKQAFMFSAPAARNHLQTDLQLDRLIPIRAFKNIVKDLKTNSVGTCIRSVSSCLSSIGIGLCELILCVFVLCDFNICIDVG